jgi:hypothetical protein
MQAFCDWLSTRENGRWHYRLPHKDEVTQALSHIKRAVLSVSDIGFWADDNEFIWLNKTAPEDKNLEELVRDQLLLDRAQALTYDRVRARDRREPIDEALELERELNEMQALDTTPLLVDGIGVHPLAFDRSYFTSDVVSEAVKIVVPTLLNYQNLLVKRSSPPYTEEKKHLRWFTRYQSQLQAHRTYFWLQHTNISLKKQQRLLRQFRMEKSLTEQEFVFYRRICNDFALLELREKGKLPPWEAILLVKERQLFSLS